MALAVVPGAGPTAPTPSLASADGPLQPPPDIKNIVDKTAQFVARNGPEFEQRILSDNEKKQNPKFAFLQASDPFHAYYVAKVQELGGTTTLAPAAGAAPAAAVAAPGAGQVSADATVAASKKKKAPSVTPLEPARPMHTVPKPPGAQPLDLDVIQLTAQFVARNGRTFLTGIANREARNPQFDFLKPTHHLFSYFTSLVDAYSKMTGQTRERVYADLDRDNRGIGGTDVPHIPQNLLPLLIILQLRSRAGVLDPYHKPLLQPGRVRKSLPGHLLPH